jgi:Uma2 family endonuclease
MAAGPVPRADCMSFDEAARLDPDRRPGELDAGRWVPVTRSTWRHGQIVGNVYVLLRAYARAHPGWSVSVGDPGTKLGHDPDVLRGPDTAIVRADREPTGTGAAGWLDGAPDVAVEVVGDAQSVSEVTRKALQYLAAGGRMVWLLDPGPRRLLLFTPPSALRVLGPDEMLDGGDVLPGFSATVAELFE